MFEQKWLEPKWVCCLVLCCVVCCLVCCLVLCEVCCVRCGGVSVCSRFSWVRPRFARTNLNRTRPSAGPPKIFPSPATIFFLSGIHPSSCETPSAWGPHTTARELQTRTFQGSGHERTPKREERKKIVAGEGKKARNFGPPPFWLHPVRGVT